MPPIHRGLQEQRRQKVGDKREYGCPGHPKSLPCVPWPPSTIIHSKVTSQWHHLNNGVVVRNPRVERAASAYQTEHERNVYHPKHFNKSVSQWVCWLKRVLVTANRDSLGVGLRLMLVQGLQDERTLLLSLTKAAKDFSGPWDIPFAFPGEGGMQSQKKSLWEEVADFSSTQVPCSLSTEPSYPPTSPLKFLPTLDVIILSIHPRVPAPRKRPLSLETLLATSYSLEPSASRTGQKCK